MPLSRNAIVVLICGALVVIVSMGLRSAFGLLLKPISVELGLGREVFSFAVALATLLTGFGGPIAGALGDRYGAAWMAAVGGLFLGVGLYSASHAQGSLGLQWSFGLLVGIGMTAASLGVMLGAVARAVPAEKRTLAFGLLSAGASLGQFLMIPAAQALIATWDWRTACQVLAAVAIAIIPFSLGLRERRDAGRPVVAGATSIREALREASVHPGFWMLTAAFFVCGMHVAFVSTHLAAFLTDRGMSGLVAANALALMGLFNVIGTLLSGWIGNRFRHRYVLALMYASRTLIFLPMIFLPMSPVLAFLFASVMGLFYLATATPTSGIVAQVFGSRYFSMLFGIVFGAHQIGGFFGSWMGGYVFDRTGSYDVMWWIAIGLGVLATALSIPIRDAPLDRSTENGPVHV